MAFDLNGSGGDGDISYDSGKPRKSPYAPSYFQGPIPSVDTDVSNPPNLSRYAPPPEAPVTADHMGPQSPLDYMLGKYNESENAYKSLLEKGPDQFKPSIWRRIAGIGLGTLAGQGGQRMGYGRYSGFASNPEEAGRTTREFVFGPQGKLDADYKRRLEASRVGSDEAMKNYQLTRQQGVDDLQQRNIASEMEARNRPQVVQADDGTYYRVPQESGPASAIPIAATMPETLGENTQLPQNLVGPTKNPPADSTAITDLDINGQNNKVIIDKNPNSPNYGKPKVIGPSKLPTVSPGAADNRSDRSYQFHTKQFETLGKPIQDRADRMARLQLSMNQNDPAADPLIAPELLTAMAGGQGSGLRMNEAEIARIVGGRNVWSNMKSNLDKWSLDKSKPFLVQPEQRAAYQKLINAMNERVQGKLQMLTDAQQRLADSNDPAQHKQIFAEAKRRIMAIDNISDTAGVDSRNGRAVYHSGGKLIYGDGSEPPK